jgi:hypothetical protein
MRIAFAHEAEIVMDPTADAQAPGAAITASLCGHWDHQPPCPRAPHHTRAERIGAEVVRLRILFATEPEEESAVRADIDAALTGGQLADDGRLTGWQPSYSRPSDVRPDEQAHAERLIRS